MYFKRVSPLLLLSAAVLSGCGDDATGPSDLEPLRVVAGAEAADTVLTPLLQALTVEVRDEDGQPLEGAVVRFQAMLIEEQNQWGGYTAYISPIDLDSYGTFAVDSTDRNGRARTLVQLGRKAGIASIVITVPEIGVADTAHFTVLPGNATNVAASPRDTALYVGNSFIPRSAVTDQFGNPRDDEVAFEVIGSAVEVKDGRVTAKQTGASKLVVKAIGGSDTTFVSVPPKMTLAAMYGNSIVTVDADGSGYRVLTTLQSGALGYMTDWSPDGLNVAYDYGYFESAGLGVVGMDGVVENIAQSDGSWRLYPKYATDGSWIYYSRDAGGWRLYRVNPDAPGEEAVPMDTPSSDVAPAPSPDGTRLAYVVTSGFGDDHLHVLDLTSGESTDLHVTGHSPVWSPAGDLIASLAPGSKLQVLAPDGTGVRNVGDASARYDYGIDWSPDGKWLLARNLTIGELQLINVQSGQILSLGFTAGYRGPSWKP